MTLKTELNCDFTVRNDLPFICPEKREYEVTIKEESMDYDGGSSQVRDHSSKYLFMCFHRI